MSERWIALGFYQNQNVAHSALKELRRHRLGRSTAIYHSPEGRVTTAYFGLPKPLVERFKRWVIRNETLIVVEARSRNLARVQEILRHGMGSQAVVFAFHEKHADAQSLDSALFRMPPLSVEALRQEASRLAEVLQPGNPRSVARQSLRSRLAESESELKLVEQALGERARAEQAGSMSAAWLLDNAYILQEHIDDFRRNLPRRYYEELPILTNGPYAGLPRVYGIASELITETDLRFDSDRVVAFLQSFQNIAPLTMGELWAMPLMLRSGPWTMWAIGIPTRKTCPHHPPMIYRALRTWCAGPPTIFRASCS